MIPFIFTLPVRIIFGQGIRNQLLDELPPMKTPLLLTGSSSLAASGELEKIKETLSGGGHNAVHLKLNRQQPGCREVEELARVARSEGCDGVIAIGGGSVLDAGKGIALLLACPESARLLDYMEEWEENTRELPGRVPLVLVPTTAATGSEANCGAVFTDGERNLKFTFFHPLLYADLALVDPELTVTLSRDETMRGGFDTFCHLLEPYLTREGESRVTATLVEGMLVEIPRLLAELEADPGNVSIREEMSLLSLLGLSGLADLGFSGVFPLHDLAAPLSARTGIAHAAALAGLIVPLCRHNAENEVCSKRMACLGRILFQDPTAEGFISGINGWLEKLAIIPDIPLISNEMAETMAFDALTLFGGGKMSVDSPVPLTIIDMCNLYQEACQ